MIRIKKRYKVHKKNCTPTPEFSALNIKAEITEALQDLKHENAAGLDSMYLEFLINCDINTRR